MALKVLEWTGIYQAEGSLVGEVRYVVGRMLGTAHCALCDITHGSVREKKGFAACRQALPVPFKNVHLDERSETLRAFTEGKTPCVVAHTDEGLRLVLDAHMLEGCAGSVTSFRDLLDAQMRVQDLTY
ncbi:unnamed protein product [Laminaria digitata]